MIEFMSNLRIGFFAKRRNETGHSVVVLSTQEYRPNKYFDSLDDAMKYANSIQLACCLGEGFSIYKWVNNKWVFIMKWVKRNYV